MENQMEMELKSYTYYPRQGEYWAKKELEEDLRISSIHSAKWFVPAIAMLFFASLYWDATIHTAKGWSIVWCFISFIASLTLFSFFFIKVFRRLVSLVLTVQKLKNVDVGESYCEFFLVHFDCFMPSDEILRDLEECGLRPATLPELLKCKNKYPSLRLDTIVSIWVDECPKETGQLFEGWPAHYKFLVTNK
jgi:hypothetical protein